MEEGAGGIRYCIWQEVELQDKRARLSREVGALDVQNFTV